MWWIRLKGIEDIKYLSGEAYHNNTEKLFTARLLRVILHQVKPCSAVYLQYQLLLPDIFHGSNNSECSGGNQ